ncbi:unnamed protein product [[Actinomadura] parvosata subsp. kistnae]|uniref:Uncharacterized protein n=1 Tax=[Actinomadura] parvosata subsp. kistnae TaxID=1909395 RepID=A0A1V0AJL3_9ACTN|nr:hypothetical protein [Nonomuraea sp. ATCC 55076]AQZ70396.1 hypothetical protein BKM31_14700 [Nonomuraea sp. ATCC 55076]SPL88806.1 unnamed protein product [Actinomadura parvosata subsp. kistnae]
MTTLRGPRSAAEIRTYLKDRLNQALRRPGMFGGEKALRLLFDHLAYAEHQETEWAQALESLEARGAFNSLGVTGALATVLPDPCDDGVASIYAELAHDRGWLQADRTLTTEEHASLRRKLIAWTAHDRTLTDVREEFGPPSVLLGGTNPCFGMTLAYLTGQVTEPIIFFHLWNGGPDETEMIWRSSYDEPVLLAVRFGREAFKDTFTFTPEGSRRRPA